MTQDMELDKKQQGKWYFKTYALIMAFLFVGPFALPLVWLNPDFSVKKKSVITLIVIFITYFLGILVNNSLKTIIEYYKLVL
ncbi:MAG: hypothetical protein KJ952_03595 [Candidatus Omnitrophica bacterium]|nr:hypothetical protein [Candidatus Omnitrophota bacterium]